jgi:hypothetical protein
MPSNISAIDAAQRTAFSSSYIIFPDAPEPWPYFPPAAPEPRRPPMARADVYASLLQAAEYLDASQAALRDGADASVLDALGVLSAIVAVVTGQLRGSSFEQLSVH